VIEGYRERCDTKTILAGRGRGKRPIELDIPNPLHHRMSFGALSLEAKMGAGGEGRLDGRDGPRAAASGGMIAARAGPVDQVVTTS